MKQTQNAKILKALNSGRKLTSLDVFRVSGSLNAHKRVREIEDQYGISVKRLPIKRNGRRLRVFSL